MDCIYVVLSSTLMVPQSTLQWPLIHLCTQAFIHLWLAAVIQGAASPIWSNQGSVCLPKTLKHVDSWSWNLNPKTLDHQFEAPIPQSSIRRTALPTEPQLPNVKHFTWKDRQRQNVTKNSVIILSIGESALLENQLSLEVTGCCDASPAAVWQLYWVALQTLSVTQSWPLWWHAPCVYACMGEQVLFVSDASDTPADMVRLVSSVSM